jgi:hypothetical protein
LREIKASVEGLYHDGRPLHHKKSARLINYNPNDPRVSSIFVVNYADFKKMKPRDIQMVYRKRHILVLGVETERLRFDLQGLATLGALAKPRQMQGLYQIEICTKLANTISLQLQKRVP